MRPAVTLSRLSSLIATLLALTSCSAHHRPHDVDAEPDGDISADGDAPSSDGDADADEESDVLGPEDVPDCGDGVLDPEEECDDRNRLNGDGCDWLCRLGDGAPPPDVDPASPEYGPEGTPTPTTAIANDMLFGGTIMPLVWTGSELATAFLWRSDDREIRRLHFLRFDEYGGELDGGWNHDLAGWTLSLELVWTGEGYTLFFDSLGGISSIRLSPTGDPLSEPALLVEDPCSDGPIADAVEGGYVLAWVIGDFHESEGARCYGEPPNPDAGAYLALHADDSAGSTLAGPAHLDCQFGCYSKVAAGSSSFGVAWQQWFEPYEREEVSFFTIDEELLETVTSGVLSEGYPPSVVFADDLYWVVWRHQVAFPDGERPGPDELCVARFSTDGLLLAAPVCSALDVFINCTSSLRVAHGDGGLGVVLSGYDGVVSRPFFIRTDASGVIVGEPVGLEVTDPSDLSGCGSYGIAWTGTAFAVLYSEGPDAPLRLQRFSEVGEE